MGAFIPRSGIAVATLAKVAERLGQNVGWVDDWADALGMAEEGIEADPDAAAEAINFQANELEAMLG